MTTLALRNRYLAALGISGSLLSGCSSTEPGGTTPTATTDPVATATSDAPATATAAPVEMAAIATATAATATAATAAFWEPTVFAAPTAGNGPDEPNTTRMPSCPSGAFCVAEADAVGSTMAPSPFAKCAVQVNDPQRPSSRSRSIHFDKEQTRRERTKTKDACCYGWVIPCPGGRPLMVDGLARVAAARESPAWLPASRQARALDSVLTTLPRDEREALAVHYATEAAYEHASIAAFSRVSLALLAVGAPADLVADTHRAALDEIRHAEAMYRLASAFRGAAVGPGALSLVGARLTASLVELATEAFIEGCVGEVAAALVLREEAERAPGEATRDVLAAIAADEERHAELAWRTVAWALGQDARVRAALEESRAALAAELSTELPPPSRGLPFVTSARERISIRRDAIREVVLPCLGALLARDVA